MTNRNLNSVAREPNKTVSIFNLSVEERLSVMEALDHLFVTRQYQEMGSCSVCKKISIKKCSGCSVFYCSSECQTFDWPKHRMNCAKQRDSVSERNSFASNRRMRGFSAGKNFNEESLLISNNCSPFTNLANQLCKKSAIFIENKNLANFKIANKQYQNKSQQSKVNDVVTNNTAKDHKSNSSKRNSSPKKSSSSKKSSPDEKKAAAKNTKNCRNGQQTANNKLPRHPENIPSSSSAVPPAKKQPSLIKVGKVEVVGTYRESPDRCWVMRAKHLVDYENIQAILNKSCKNFETVAPKVGLVCGCVFSDEWFRGEILSLTPDIVVRFIDYGNISNYEVKVFKKLPNELRSLPGLAFLIEFEPSTSDRFKTEDLDSVNFTIEETSKAPDGVPRVKVIEENEEGEAGKVVGTREEEKLEEGNHRKVGSVMDLITATSSGMLFLMPGEGPVRFASIVPDNEKDANECIEKVLHVDSSNLTPYAAKEGELVLVTDKEGNDQRGRVVSNLGSTYYVQLIDCGNVISSENVYPLAEDLKDLIELGVRVTIEEVVSQEQMKDLETCFFVVTGESVAGRWPCTLKGTEQQIIAKVFLEKPHEKIKWRPKYEVLKSGSTVEISSVISPDAFYVRPVDVEMEQKFLEMNMEMMQSLSNAKSFDIPPLPGELCCAKFTEDGLFYRAIVNAVEGEKVWVLFVDFGNEQETDLNDIKPLPESLKEVPFFAVKVALKGVSKKPWNNMIKEYIGKLTSENVEVTLTYEKSLSDGVVLREKVSGVVVNEFMEKAKDQSKAETPKKPEIFLDDDMKYTKLNPGSSCTLAILYVSEKEFESGLTFWATAADVKNFNYVNIELSSLIGKYCDSVSAPYRPSFRELCLAEFEGSWYRAICAECTGDVFKVFFVDFGNFCPLKSESIRKMPKEFIEAPALAMNCTLHSREKLKGNPELTKEVCEALMGRINTFIEGVTVSSFVEDTFVLKIPEIEAMLSR